MTGKEIYPEIINPFPEFILSKPRRLFPGMGCSSFVSLQAVLVIQNVLNLVHR